MNLTENMLLNVYSEIEKLRNLSKRPKILFERKFEIEKGIQMANLGFNPMNNGESVIINVPPLTEERRRDLVKQAKAEAEDARVSIRNARQDANKELKRLDISEDLLSNAEIDVQELTDEYTQKVENVFQQKEVEIMKV